MKKNLIAAGVVALLLSACSKSGSNDSNNNSNNKNKNAQVDPNSQEERTEQHKETYRFILNGCDTGKHDFGSNNSDDVKKQLCDALVDDKLNNSCAEPLRYEFFNKKCSGYTWAPKYGQPTNAPTQPTPSNPSFPGDDQKEEKIRNALKMALVDNYEVESTLAGLEKAATAQFGEDMMSCGVSHLGPKCLDYITYMGNYGSLSDVNGKSIFYSELKIKGTGTPVAFKFMIDQVDPAVKVGQLEVSKIVKPRNGQSVSSYLRDQSNLAPLLRATLNLDFQKGAWLRLAKPRNIREIFHMSKGLLETSMQSNTYQQTRNRLADVIQKNKSIIIQSKDTEYQENILPFIMSEIQVNTQTLVEICNGLLNSKSADIQQIAATLVMDSQPDRTELKPIVVKALSNPRWDIRKQAISALSKTTKTTADENLILLRIDDQDEDVRKAAISAAAKISVNEENLKTVKQLASSQNWAVRLEAAKLLSRINSQEAIKELISKMDDQDEDVRKEVVSQLNQKSLAAVYVPPLADTFESSNWWVRNEVAKFLGKIDADSATLTLIKKMDDQDEDVRNTIFQQLKKKNLSEGNVTELTRQYKSHNWSVRKDVSTLLGKISGLPATNALIKQMDDEDEDVRDIITSQLTARTLTSESVPGLKKNFASQNWSVRRDTAKLIGKIKSPASLEALQNQLKQEIDEDVKKQIVESIQALK